MSRFRQACLFSLTKKLAFKICVRFESYFPVNMLLFFQTFDIWNGYRIFPAANPILFLWQRGELSVFYAVGSVFCFVLFCSSPRLFFCLSHFRKVRKRRSHSLLSSQPINLDSFGPKHCFVLCSCFSVAVGDRNSCVYASN